MTKNFVAKGVNENTINDENYFVAENKNINISTLSAMNPSSSLKVVNSDEFEFLTKALILI